VGSSKYRVDILIDYFVGDVTKVKEFERLLRSPVGAYFYAVIWYKSPPSFLVVEMGERQFGCESGLLEEWAL
jgi:hypothetical protein